MQAIVESNVKNLGWALCFSPMVNSVGLRFRNAFDLLRLIFRKIYAMDLQLHRFHNRLHRLEPKAFADIVEMVRITESILKMAGML